MRKTNWRKKMKIAFIIIFCFILIGCNFQEQSKQLTAKVNLGKCIEVRVIPTSFNESPKTQVVTDKGFYILVGYLSFDKDQDVIVDEKIIRRK